MNINLLLIILIALGIWRAVRGFKTGLAEEVNRLVSLVVALFVLALAIMAISSFMDHNNQNGIIAIILILITGIVFHLLSIVLRSLNHSRPSHHKPVQQPSGDCRRPDGSSSRPVDYLHYYTEFSHRKLRRADNEMDK